MALNRTTPNNEVADHKLQVLEKLTIPVGDDFSGNTSGSLKKKSNGRLALDGQELATLDDLPFVTPEMFGAKGDGITDDTVAIQVAYNTLNSIGGGIIGFKSSSTYVISSAIIIKLNCKTFLNGCKIKAVTSMEALLTTSPTDYHVKNLINGDFCKLDGNGLAERGVWVKLSAETAVEKIYVENTTKAYYQFGSLLNSTSYGIRANKLHGDRQRPTLTPLESKGVLFENMTDSRIDDATMISVDYGFYDVDQTASNMYNNCHAWGRLPESDIKYCFVLGGSGGMLVNCYADTPNIYGYWIKKGRWNLNTCATFNNEKGTTSLVAIRVESSATFCNFIQSQFNGTVGKEILKDIEFADSDPSYKGHTILSSSWYACKTRTNYESTVIDSTDANLRAYKHQPVLPVRADNQFLIGHEYAMRVPTNPLFPIYSAIEASYRLGISVSRGLGRYWFDVGTGLRSSIRSNDSNDLIFSHNTSDKLTIGSVLSILETRLQLLGITIKDAASIDSGPGNPIGSKIGSPGDIWLRTAGGASQSIYFKTSGINTNTGWVSIGELFQTKVVNITDATQPTIEAGGGFEYEYRWTLGGNRNVANPNSPTNGQKIHFTIKQDITGGRVISNWGTTYRFPNNIPPLLSTSPNAIDHLEFIYNSSDSKWDLVSFKKGDEPLYIEDLILVSEQTSTTLNTKYPNVTAKTIVIAPNVGTGKEYTKLSNNTWVSKDLVVI